MARLHKVSRKEEAMTRASSMRRLRDHRILQRILEAPSAYSNLSYLALSFTTQIGDGHQQAALEYSVTQQLCERVELR